MALWAKWLSGRAHGDRGKYPKSLQHGGLHPVQLLPLACTGPAAGLVQKRCLPVSLGPRAAQSFGQLRGDNARKHPRPRLGLYRRTAHSGSAKAPCWYRTLVASRNWAQPIKFMI